MKRRNLPGTPPEASLLCTLITIEEAIRPTRKVNLNLTWLWAASYSNNLPVPVRATVAHMLGKCQLLLKILDEGLLFEMEHERVYYYYTAIWL